jgi:hypothetical protein
MSLTAGFAEAEADAGARAIAEAGARAVRAETSGVEDAAAGALAGVVLGAATSGTGGASIATDPVTAAVGTVETGRGAEAMVGLASGRTLASFANPSQ